MRIGIRTKAAPALSALLLLLACDGGAGSKESVADGPTPDVLPSGLETHLASSDQAPRRFMLGRYDWADGVTDVPDEAGPTIASLADALKAHPKTWVRIEIYTDETGREYDDDRLAALRGDRIMKALEGAGVPNVIATAGRPLPGSEPADPAAMAPAVDGRTDVILYRDNHQAFSGSVQSRR